MKKRRVLVTAVGGNIGQGIIKALRNSAIRFDITGIDMQPLSAGFAFTDRYFTVPKTTADGFTRAFEKIIISGKIEAVYVSSPSELSFFSANKEKLEKKLKIKIFVNTPAVVKTGSDKLLTARFLEKNHFSFAKTIRLSDSKALAPFLRQAHFPIILKPRCGFTSHNVFTVHSRQEIEALGAAIPDLIAQEYLPGEEYTAGMLSDEAGKTRACVVLKRDLSQGTTYRTELFRNPKIEKEMIRISDALGSVGPCNFQFKIKNSKPVIFEINPRFSGTTGVRYLYGFNDAELIFRNQVLGEPMRQPKLTKVVTLRYWNEVSVAGSNFDALKKVGRFRRAKQVTLP